MQEEDPNYELKLPDSPWTYENGDLNPSLQPSGAGGSVARRRSYGGANKTTIASVPPYHPDYKPPSEDSLSDEEPLSSRRVGGLVRRGSEGYEVRTIDREAMLKQYIVEQMQEPGRYKMYAPDPPRESDDEGIPGTSRVERWRAETAMA